MYKCTTTALALADTKANSHKLRQRQTDAGPDKVSQHQPEHQEAPARDPASSSMSVGSKSLPARRRAEEEGENGVGDGGAVARDDGGSPKGGGGRSRRPRAARYDLCFSGLELSIGPGPLKDVDAGKLKDQIRKWAKAVVAFARQISFGSPRSTPKSGSGGEDTPRSATFPAASRSSRLGHAKNAEPPT